MLSSSAAEALMEGLGLWIRRRPLHDALTKTSVSRGQGRREVRGHTPRCPRQEFPEASEDGVGTLRPLRTVEHGLQSEEIPGSDGGGSRCRAVLPLHGTEGEIRIGIRFGIEVPCPLLRVPETFVLFTRQRTADNRTTDSHRQPSVSVSTECSPNRAAKGVWI